jgi:hypothetical protein
MVRAAFLMDRVMASVGLSGRAFIPLLSSFACAVPGIMATRTIADEKDRLTTILIAPLMTCSARLPVYTIIIGALIPDRNVLPGRRPPGPRPVRALHPRHRRRLRCRAGAPPHRDQGRDQRLHDGDAQIPAAAPARRGARPVAARRDLPQARRHDHPVHHRGAVGAAQLPQAARGQRHLQGRLFDRRADRQRPRRCWSRRSASTATSRSPDPGDGGARGRGGGDRHRLCGRQSRRCRGRGDDPPESPGALDPADRARLPDVVRLRAAMHLDDRGHAARDQWLEMADAFMVGYLFALAYVAAGITYWSAVGLGL